MNFVLRNICCCSSLLILGACSTDYAARQASDIPMEKMADIENEPITRLSFLPAQEEYDSIKVVVYQDADALNDVMPASGDVVAEEKVSK